MGGNDVLFFGELVHSPAFVRHKVMRICVELYLPKEGYLADNEAILHKQVSCVRDISGLIIFVLP